MYALPAGGQPLPLERMRPVRRLRVVVDVILPAAQRVIHRPAGGQGQLLRLFLCGAAAAAAVRVLPVLLSEVVRQTLAVRHPLRMVVVPKPIVVRVAVDRRRVSGVVVGVDGGVVLGVGDLLRF